MANRFPSELGGEGGKIIPGFSNAEIQKLAYLLQATGEPLRLQFIQGYQGPYAANLHPVLRQLEGHAIEGYRPEDDGGEIRLRPGVAQAAQDCLADTLALAEPLQGKIAILDRVTRLIEGYESPYSLEILAIAHWVMQADPQAAANVEERSLRLKSGN